MLRGRLGINFNNEMCNVQRRLPSKRALAGASTHDAAPAAAALTAAAAAGVATWQGPVAVHQAAPVPRSSFVQELDAAPEAPAADAGRNPPLGRQPSLSMHNPQEMYCGCRSSSGSRARSAGAGEAQAYAAAAALHAAARQLDAGPVRSWTDYLKARPEQEREHVCEEHLTVFAVQQQACACASILHVEMATTCAIYQIVVTSTWSLSARPPACFSVHVHVLAIAASCISSVVFTQGVLHSDSLVVRGSMWAAMPAAQLLDSCRNSPQLARPKVPPSS